MVEQKTTIDEEEVKAKIFEQIKELLKPLCDGCTHTPTWYAHTNQISIVTDLVEFFAEVGKWGDRSKPLPPPKRAALSLQERIKIKTLNDARDHIIKDLIENNHKYPGHFGDPQNKYDRGVFNAVGLINHRINCIYDDCDENWHRGEASRTLCRYGRARQSNESIKSPESRGHFSYIVRKKRKRRTSWEERGIW